MECASCELAPAPGVPTAGLEAAALTFCAKEGCGGHGKPRLMTAPQAVYPWGLTSVCRKQLP